jgi:hypothetical protein
MTNTQKKTIVCFHIGRGGHFHNAGFLSFIGENNIDHYTDDLFTAFENQYDLSKKIKGRPNLIEKYYECCDKDDFSFFKKLGFDLGEKYYFDGGGANTGLLIDNDGTGRIEIDGEYNTTYCKVLNDCTEEELLLIVGRDNNNSDTYLDAEAKKILEEGYLNFEYSEES